MISAEWRTKEAEKKRYRTTIESLLKVVTETCVEVYDELLDLSLVNCPHMPMSDVQCMLTDWVEKTQKMLIKSQKMLVEKDMKVAFHIFDSRMRADEKEFNDNYDADETTHIDIE